MISYLKTSQREVCQADMIQILWLKLLNEICGLDKGWTSTFAMRLGITKLIYQNPLMFIIDSWYMQSD